MLSRTFQPASELCSAFRTLATDVHDSIGRGRTVDLMPWETTLTNCCLLALATSFPEAVKIRRFGAEREAATGADWEWWFRGGTDFVGMRVQAKRRDDSGGWGLKSRAPGEPNERQVDRLVRRAREDGLIPFYCLYSDRPIHRPTYNLTGPCPHGPLDQTQWGISFLLANTAQRHAAASPTRSNVVAADGFPWFRLVCHDRQSWTPVESIRWQVQHAINKELRARQQVDPWQRDITGMAGRPEADPPEDILEAFDDAAALAQIERFDVAGVVLVDAPESG